MSILPFLFLFSALTSGAVADKNCPVYACPKDGIPIRFPFRLQHIQSQGCGYKGFNLNCSDNGSGTTALSLPGAGDFFVRHINYFTQQIELYDSRACLPRLFLNGFSLSASPFVAEFLHNFTFISCPPQATVSGFTRIDCLTNDTVSVLATPFTRSVPESCTFMATLEVPVSGPAEYGEGLAARLEDNLRLSWYEPYCRDCVLQGGTCGLYYVTQDVVCYFDPSPVEGRGHRVFRIIALSIALPAIMLTFAIACFTCFANRQRSRERGMRSIQVNNSAVLPAEPMNGLDECTIESYTKLVVGESGRLPGPNDSTCPICLAEYCAKDTLRCIPECQHCFHADCIDQWLRLNSTCPVCRKSPSPSSSPLPVHALAIAPR